MKRYIKTCAFAVLVFCSNLVSAQPIKVNNAALRMQGAYTLLRQTVDAGTGPEVQNIEQNKLYTDKYMMYAHRNSAQDSLAAFGIGTYKMENGKVMENVFYTQDGPVNSTYELAITKLPAGYKQVIRFAGGNQPFLLTEDYRQTGKGMTSPLDGAWKMVNFVSTDANGNVSTNDQRTQFKVYESGSFIWANSWKDEATQQYKASFGSGHFVMNAPDKATETVTNTTYTTDLGGQSVTLGLKFIGNDRFEQTIIWPNGIKNVETYERLK